MRRKPVRKHLRLRASSLLFLAVAAVFAGCADVNRMGDVGHKNIRPNRTADRFADDRANEMNRTFGRQMNNNNIVPGRHGNTYLELNQRVAERLADLPEIDSAYVMLTDSNAYVAVVEAANGGNGAGRDNGGAGGDVADDLKVRVADCVRSLVPGVQNVYVTANPDFYSRLQNWAEAVRQGRPLQGFVKEFNALVARLFPDQGDEDNAAGGATRTRKGVSGSGLYR